MFGGDMSEGADENDVLAVVGALGHPWTECNTSRKREAEAWLKKFTPVSPVLLCVDNWGHWVTVAGVCGRRVCLHDSLKVPHNVEMGGTHWLRLSTVTRRWRAARRRIREGGELYYGIAVLPCGVTSA